MSLEITDDAQVPPKTVPVGTELVGFWDATGVLKKFTVTNLVVGILAALTSLTQSRILAALKAPTVNATVTANAAVTVAGVTSLDETIPVNAAAGTVTLTLEAAAGFMAGQIIRVAKIDSTGALVYLAKNSADTFSNGVPTLPINVQGDSWTITAAPALNMWVVQ